MGNKPIHDQVVEILPWFVNNSLGQREQKKVLSHLRDCAACQLERDRLQELQGLLQEETVALPDYRFAYGKLMRRIEAADANRASTQGFGHQGRQPARNSAAVWLGAAASLAAAVMLVAALDNDGTASDGQFRTLNDAPVVESASVPHLVALRFEQPIRAETLRRVLIETGASIKSGPSDEGTYMVELQVPPAMAERAFIQHLESIDGVSFAAFSDGSNGALTE